MNFEALANEHKDSVYRQMLRVCGNHEDAEDVLVEALTNAYRSMDHLRDPASFKAWLAQIARRVCWQLKEKEALLPLIQLGDMDEEGFSLRDRRPAPEDAVAAAQLRQILRSAVEGLPAEFREVYELRDMQEISGEEVASRLGITLAAMKSRLHRARTMLRQRIEASLLHPQQARSTITGSQEP